MEKWSNLKGCLEVYVYIYLSALFTTCFSNLLCLYRAAAMSLRTMLLSIQALLASPEPDDPQDAVVAKQYKSNPSAFSMTAKHWASIYANGPSRQPGCEAKVAKLVQMGFTEVVAIMYTYS